MKVKNRNQEVRKQTKSYPQGSYPVSRVRRIVASKKFKGGNTGKVVVQTILGCGLPTLDVRLVSPTGKERERHNGCMLVVWTNGLMRDGLSWISRNKEKLGKAFLRAVNKV